MKHFLCAVLAAAFLAACSNKPSGNTGIDSSATVPVTARATIANVQSHRPNIDLTPWDGQLYDAVYWTDSRGENIVIISGNAQYFWEEENPEARKFFPKGEDEETLSELTEIFAKHYVLKRGEAKWNEYYAYHDYMFSCCDVWMEYQRGSLTVLDADSNATGEAIFMYHETEADGKISNWWHGNMVLLIDSAKYVSEGGSGFQMEGDAIPKNDSLKASAPATGPYPAIVQQRWNDFSKKWVQQLRDAITEQGNLDEHGHADHVH